MKREEKKSEKQILLEKWLLEHAHDAIGWAYYAGSCRCFSLVSDEKLKRFVKSTQRRILRYLRRMGLIPCQGTAPSLKGRRNYSIHRGKMFPGDLPFYKDLENYRPKCRKRGIPDKEKAKFTLEMLRWGM